MPATTVQTLADRLSRALKRFLQRKDLRLSVGFPRFKTSNRWHSIQLRQYAAQRDVWLDDDDANGKHLHVPAKLGRLLTVKRHRPLHGTPVTAHLVMRADGHWYALIVCETAPQAEQGIVHPERAACEGACEHPAIGLDVGPHGVSGRLGGRHGGEPAPLSLGPAAPGARPAHGLSAEEG